jgi:outer membrane protein insertion porin family
MYVVRTEVEIPMGSGVRELGIRPSVFFDVGSVFGITDPILTVSPIRTASSSAARRERERAVHPDRHGRRGQHGVHADLDLGHHQSRQPQSAACLPTASNAAIGSSLPPFVEEFYGDTWKPRVAVGIGVNWNSPFGPFRINLAYALVSYEGDDTKRFSFNVGTQF